MTKLILSIIFLASPFLSRADTNLLDLIKSKKYKFYINPSCMSYIQNATHETFKSPELLKLTGKLKDNIKNEKFYHYTDFQGRRIFKRAIRRKDFGPILTYVMGYEDALSAAAGPGLYLANNPFTSSGYGPQQLALTLSQDSIYIDLNLHNVAINKILSQFTSDYNFQACFHKLQLSLLLDENGIDIAKYSDSNGWFVLLNEDIIEAARVKRITGSDNEDITRRMIKLGEMLDLLPYMRLIDLARLTPKWDNKTQLVFANKIAEKEDRDMEFLVGQFDREHFLPESKLLSLPLGPNCSDQFLNYLLKKVENDPSIIKSWGLHYANNVAILSKRQNIDLTFFSKFAPTPH